MAQERDSTTLGLPLELFPLQPIQNTFLIGGKYFGILICILILIYLTANKLAPFIPQSFRDQIKSKAWKIYTKYPTILYIMVILYVFALSSFLPRYLPLTKPFKDERLPRVIDIKPNHSILTNNERLLFFSNKNEMIILKRPGLNSFVILRQDEVNKIEIAKCE